MIVDNIKNAKLYYGLSDNIKKGLEFLKNTSFEDTSEAKFEIDGKTIFASMREFTQKPLSEGRSETHNKYIDIHYIVKGEQFIGYAKRLNMDKSEGYNEEKDLEFWQGKTDMVKLNAGDFMITFPDDVHCPDIATYEGVIAKKVVVKILF